MINYIKSEWYRITRGREIYMMTGILSGLIVLMNVTLAVSDRVIKNFSYGSIRFSLSFATSGLFRILIAGAAVTAFLYGEEKQNGTWKNAVAYGVSRKNIFLGKCVVSILSAVCSLVVILFIYVGSACLLLKGPAEEAITKMLGGIGATFLCAAAVWFFARWQFLNRAVRKTERELKEIIQDIEENRILKQEGTNKELEKLLITINLLLKEALALGMSGLLYTVSKVFAPLVWLLTASTNGILRLLRMNPDEEDEVVTEEEILMMLSEGNEQGTIQEEENEIIQNVFEFDDISVEEICTHRREVVYLSTEDREGVVSETQ